MTREKKTPCGGKDRYLKRLNYPVMLTLLRLVLLPAAALCVLLQPQNGLVMAGCIVAVAGATDALDGYLARKYRQVTALGAQLDLLIDKVFISTMLIVLAAVGLIAWWIPAVVVFREMAVFTLRQVHFRGKPISGPDIWGKIKMAVSVVAIVWILLQQDMLNGGPLSLSSRWDMIPHLLNLAPVILLAAVALTLLSGINYFVMYLGLIPGGRSLLPRGGPRENATSPMRKVAVGQRPTATEAR